MVKEDDSNKPLIKVAPNGNERTYTPEGAFPFPCFVVMVAVVALVESRCWRGK